MARLVEPTGEVVERSAVRVLLIDPLRRVLLNHYVTPDTDDDFWCTPGGALDPGEDDRGAALRELWEELGFDAAPHDLGPIVATRVHRFVIGDGRTFNQSERFYMLRVDTFDPAPAALSAFETLAIRGHQWWPIAAMRSTRADISPRRLADLIDGTTPDLPLQAGV